jgi:hypothetical protein
MKVIQNTDYSIEISTKNDIFLGILSMSLTLILAARAENKLPNV